MAVRRMQVEAVLALVLSLNAAGCARLQPSGQPTFGQSEDPEHVVPNSSSDGAVDPRADGFSERDAGSSSVAIPPEASDAATPRELVDASAAPSGSSAVEAGCHQYEPKTVVLRGVVERAHFPGPPNYESIANGDARETVWLLRLDRSICLDPSTEIYNQPRRGVRRIQLVLHGDDPYKRYRSLFGQSVEATGELFGAHTGHHHTEVLLSVKELQRARRR